MTIRERAEARRKAEAEAAAKKGGTPDPTLPLPSIAPEGVRGRVATIAEPATVGDPRRMLESTVPDLPYGTHSGDGTLHKALTAAAANLCIWLEPPPSSRAWLAVQAEEGPSLILILRLPLANRTPGTNAGPEEIPF